MAQAVGSLGAAGGTRAFPIGTVETYKWWVLVTAVFGAFATVLDSTIVNIAIPKLQAVFGADLHQISYVSTAYTLAQAAVIPATAFLANRFGIKRIYLLSLTAFTLSSALCGLAWDTSSLILFRVVQGVGGAALFPLSFAIVFAAFPPSQRGRANGFFGIPILVAPAIGPTLGGFIVQYVDWRWIFFVNVPVGILGVVLGRAILRETPPRPGLRFDLPGFAVISAGLALLLYGLSNLSYDGWGSATTVAGPIILAALLIALWIPLELTRAHPILDVRLFGRRNYAIGTIAGVIATIALISSGFLLPQYLQSLRGLDPFPAGVLLFTTGVGTLAGTIMTGALYNRLGPRVLIGLGALASFGGTLALHGWATYSSPFDVLPLIGFVRGLGFPLMLVAGTTAAQDGIEGPALAGSSTLSVVTRNTGAALSIAFFANLLQTNIIVHGSNLAAQTSLANPATASMVARLTGAFMAQGDTFAAAHQSALARMARAIHAQAAALSFQDVFLVIALVTLPALPLALLLRLRRHKPGSTSLPIE